MKKHPVTAAVRFLRARQIAFVPHEYDREEHGGTAQSARALGVDEHRVIKTIVLADESARAMIVLMHGDREISTRNLARFLGVKHIEPVSPQTAHKLTGYLVGGISPFGIKTALPIYAQKSIADFGDDEIYINGGKRGFLFAMRARDLEVLRPVWVDAAV